MDRITTQPVLIVGGSGTVGSRAVRALRRLQPDLPITIAARNMSKATALAEEVGNADAVAADLSRRDLGLPSDRTFGAVVVLLKDGGLNTMKYAQAHGLPYISFSDFAFDVAPEIALFVQQPAASPTLLLGHYLGGIATMATLYFAREFRRVDEIRIGGILDKDDFGGPTAQEDFERLVNSAPNPFLYENGKLLWPAAEQAVRTYSAVDGTEQQGQPYALLDVPSLVAVTGARSVRVDLAVRPDDRTGSHGPSHETLIEMTGEQNDGVVRSIKRRLIDSDIASGFSAKGLALAIERMLGLAGGPPVPPGLYNPETLLDPTYVIERIKEFGVQVQAE